MITSSFLRRLTFRVLATLLADMAYSTIYVMSVSVLMLELIKPFIKIILNDFFLFSQLP